MATNNKFYLQSPPWHIKSGITRWKGEPLYPNPFSPVHKHLKFSAVFGTTSDLSSITTLPNCSPLADMSKYTLGNDSPDSADNYLIEANVYAPRLVVIMSEPMRKLFPFNILVKNDAIF